MAAPDVVGPIEAIAQQNRRVNVNGKEEVFEETQLRIVVQGGTRRTIRLDKRTVLRKMARPTLGMVVLIWLDPQVSDLAIHVERSVE
jgi:hypothetical protein